MSKTGLLVGAMALALVACKKDKAAEGPAATSATAQPSGQGAQPTGAGKPVAASPHGGTTSAHGGQPGPAHGGQPSAGAGAPMTSPGPGPIDLGGIKLTVPKGWTPETPKSNMRAAQYGIGTGPDRAEVVVFYFKKQGAGGVQANFQRWAKQFTKVDGEPKVSERMVGQMKVSTIDVSGTFGGGSPMMRPGAAKPAPQSGSRMIGAIVETPAGPYYIKMTGPAKVVGAAADAFTDMIDSAKP